MKKVTILILLLPVFVTVTAQSFRHPASPRQGQVLSDTVVEVESPAAIGLNNHREWDFRSLQATPTAPVISSIVNAHGKITITENESRFYFDVLHDGNYFTGREDREKTITLHRSYNQQPHPLAPGNSYTTSYSAAGKYNASGINTSITGAYSHETLGTGTLLLPDGRRLCAATLVKTNDRYHETSCNTTEVNIEKHLWYVSYYPFPVFVVVETAYSYTGGGSDTLRNTYYTINEMPAPEIQGNNDTTVCLGSEVTIRASGYGQFFLRNHTLNTAFEPFAETATVQPQQTTTYVLMATNEQCSSLPAFDTVTVVVETPPVLQLLSNDTTICETASVELRAHSDYLLQWYELDNNGQLFELTTTQVSPSATARYMAKAYNTACAPVSASVQVTVNPVPEPVFTTVQSGHDVVFHITTSMVGGYNYIFDFGDFSKAYNLYMPLHSYHDPGSYTTHLTVVNYRTGCERTATTQVVIDTGIDTKFLFYPNPVEHIANAIAPAAITHYRIIEAASGRVFMEKSLPGTETAVQIDMQGLHTGAYLFQVLAGGKWFSNVFIKAQ